MAKGGHGNVDPLARLGKGGQFGGDDHGGGIAQGRADPRRQWQAQPSGNAAHGLGHIGKVVVACALQPDDDAVTGQLVGAQAFELADIADPFGSGSARQRHRDQRQRQQGGMNKVSDHHRHPLKRRNQAEKPAEPARTAGLLHRALAGVDDAGIGHLRR